MPKQAPPYTPTRAIFAGLGYFAVYLGVRLLVDIPFSAIVALRSALAVGTGDMQALIADMLQRARDGSLLLTAIINVAALTTFYLIFLIRKKSACREIGLVKAPLAGLLPLVPLGVSLNVLLVAAFSLLPREWINAYAEASNALLGTALTPLAFLNVAVLAPLTEETLFRGLIYTRFRRGLPVWAAILLSSALFGVMHMQPLWMLYAACMGALLCLVMERQRTLLAPMLLHVSFNAGSFVTPMLQNVPPVPLLVGTACLCTVCLRRALTAQGGKRLYN